MKKLMSILGAVVLASFIITSCGSNEAIKKEVKSKDTKEVEVKKIEAEPISKKKEVLTNLIGEHNLNSISGASGANAMFDFGLENGKWTGSESANSGGMREAYDIEITKQDLQKLKSMKIIVDKDLKVSFSCNGKMYFVSPFKEDGMSYFLKASPKDFSFSLPENLKAETTFLDEYLYLYAKDKIAETDLEFLQFVGILADSAVLKYNTKTKEFELTIFYGECCDNATYIFK
jgi:hypothetical protein